MGEIQGMTPIAKIEIAIPIPILLRNWDLDGYLDFNLKRHQQYDRDRSSSIGDLLSDLLKFSCKNSI